MQQVTALSAGVQDSSVLVQRSALDLLLVGFPVHNSQLTHEHMVSLVTAALVTILRRDMSLNRYDKNTKQKYLQKLVLLQLNIL